MDIVQDFLNKSNPANIPGGKISIYNPKNSKPLPLSPFPLSETSEVVGMIK